MTRSRPEPPLPSARPLTGRPDYERRVRQLAGLGHRGSASARERAAADYLTAELTGAGLPPTVEPFRGSRSMGARLLVPVLIAAAGAALAWQSPPMAAVLGMSAFLFLVCEQMSGRAWLTWFLTRSPSANLTVTLPAAGFPDRRVVICAHYDTQRAGLIWNRFTMRFVAPVLARLPGPLKTPLFAVTAAMVAQMFLGVVWREWPDAVPVGPVAVTLLAVYGVMGFLLAEWAVRGYVPGSSDNASGVAAVLALAGRWLAEPVPGVELVVLLTSCEETGMLGAAAWCDRHAGEWQQVPTYFLNVDSVGFGPPRFLGCEVPMAGWPVRYPADLVRAAAETATSAGRTDAGPHAVAGPTDGLAFLVRRVPGLTVVGFRGPGVMEYYHQPGDTPEHTDFDAAWDGVGFAWELLWRLATL
jgi:Peptidase family M28